MLKQLTSIFLCGYLLVAQIATDSPLVHAWLHGHLDVSCAGHPSSSHPHHHGHSTCGGHTGHRQPEVAHGCGVQENSEHAGESDGCSELCIVKLLAHGVSTWTGLINPSWIASQFSLLAWLAGHIRIERRSANYRSRAPPLA